MRRLAWLFPLYLVLINIFVIPLALAGLATFAPGEIDRDMTVLGLPLKDGAGHVALVAFLGGLSAATAMVIVETVAVAIMISNHLVVPIVLRRRGPGEAAEGKPLPVSDLGGFVLGVRRVAIFVVTLLGYAYYRAAGDAGLAAIGLLSFAAVAQVAPAFFGGLFWSRGTALGASAGLAIGFAIWGYTLLLPSLALEGAFWTGFVKQGPFGLALLKPTALMGIELHHARADQQLDVLLGPPLVRTEEHVLSRLGALEIALGQRRAIVGRVRLASDQEHRSVRALLAQPASAVRPGEAAPDEQVLDPAAGHARRARRSGR